MAASSHVRHLVTIQLICDTMNRICVQAVMQARVSCKTNHSLWSTAATHLYQAGVNKQLGMKRMGHRPRILESTRTNEGTELLGEADALDVQYSAQCDFNLNLASCGTVNCSSIIVKIVVDPSGAK